MLVSGARMSGRFLSMNSMIGSGRRKGWVKWLHNNCSTFCAGDGDMGQLGSFDMCVGWCGKYGETARRQRRLLV